jgi:hypothetical protein
MASINKLLKNRFPETTADKLDSVEIAGFKSLVRTSETVKKTATTTTSYVEDGSFISDHIVDNPRIITIAGNISDVHIKGDPVSKVLNKAQTAVSDVNQFIPLKTQSQISKISSIANDVTDIESLILSTAQRNPRIFDTLGLSDIAEEQLKELGVGKNQIGFINKIEEIMDSQRTIQGSTQSITVGEKTYQNMVITDFEFNLDNKENSLNFSIELTEVRFATNIRTTQTESIVSENISLPSKDAVQGVSEKGTITPSEDLTLTQRIAAIRTDNLTEDILGVIGL